ncbi:MAG: glycosyltransferase [Spirochaetaceae bacterium]|jgi:glycosyltransferase involved in cell wall biosynthesis|nr:glycosyltransferase [Spirochaetaceae bacterium]
MEKPKASILVPVYNVEKYLERCIESILSQTFIEFECILVDDCSPDNSPALCDAYAQKDMRIKVIHKKQNEGLPQARKTAFENSTGDYIQFVDSDDWIESDMTEKLYKKAVESGADIVACDFYRNSGRSYSYEQQTFDVEDNFNNLGFVHCCAVWNKMFRREIIAKIEFPVAGCYEDRVITQQALFYANRIQKIGRPLYHYFDNTESMTHIKTENTVYEFRANIILVINFIREKLGNKFALKEDNVNEYVNNFKFYYVKYIKFKEKLRFIGFYPESKFWRWTIRKFLKKIVKCMVPHGLLVLRRRLTKEKM